VRTNKGGPVKPDHVKVQLRVVPSSLNLARKVPWAPLAFGGTSLKVERFATQVDLSLGNLTDYPTHQRRHGTPAVHSRTTTHSR